jgi:hypothetical protein
LAPRSCACCSRKPRRLTDSSAFALGLTVLELPSREEAVAWAARIAKACRCAQELRVFGFHPQS